MVTRGNWIRPWKGELLVGQVMAVSGRMVLCQVPGGLNFEVRLEDVVNGLVQVISGDSAYNILENARERNGLGRQRARNMQLTEKAWVS